MPALPIAIVMGLAASCQNMVAPETIVAIAKVESGFDPAAIHHNRDEAGRIKSTDYGLLQINDGNFAWLGLTPQTALDPCASIRAAAKVLTAFSGYNTGDARRGFVNGYVAKVIDAAATIKGVDTVPMSVATVQPCQEPDETGWHITLLPSHCQSGIADWHTIARR